ncbi:MAG: hypothetical protein Q9Q40_09155 [Acidobacteriota bacterium]|nr:hypothetical protein [Acidobacteriota bacterium]
MRRVAGCLVFLLLVGLSAAPAGADSAITEKTRVTLGGALGKMAGLLGGKRAREGTITEYHVRGDRMLERHGDTGRLVDLAEEKIYDIDYRRRRYSVTTFAEFRRKMERLDGPDPGGTGQEQPSPDDEGQALEYEVEVQIDETGRTEIIAGQECREVKTVVTLRQKGKSLEEGGGLVLSAGTWMGPESQAFAERLEFQRRMAEKLGFGDLEGMRKSMVSAMTAWPGMDQAMQAFRDKQAAFRGSPLRTELTIETVAGSESADPPAEAETGERPGAKLGGMLRGLGKRLRRSRGSEGERAAAADAGGKRVLMTSRTEVLSQGGEVAESAVSIPEGFKRRRP